MVRTGVPGGRLTSQQLLAHIELADKYGNGTLRITSRQDLQMHGLAKQDLRAVLKRIHEVGLTTMATCGDVHRNVVCCPAPYRGDPVHGQIQWMAGQIAEALAPRTPAYREIWLDDAPAACSAGRSPTERDRAALRQDLSAAEVQGGHRPARRQLRGRLLPGRRPAGRVPQLRRDRLQRAGRRRHGHDARQAQHLSRPGPADGLRPGRPGPRSAAGDRRRLSRLRQSQRSQAGEAEVPRRRLGPRAFQEAGRAVPGLSNCRRRSPTKSGTSTTTSAGASRATAAGSTACTCPADGSRTRARCG